jgi:hypothetical protein
MHELRIQLIRIAQRKAPALVERDRIGVHCDDGIPEIAHQLHLSRIVPDIDCDDATVAHRARHFRYCALGLGHEVERQAGDRDVEAAVSFGKHLGIADRKRRMTVDDARLSVFDEAARNVDTMHVQRIGTIENDPRQCAGSTAHIEPFLLRRYMQPIEELASHQSAPAADVRLVQISGCPLVDGLGIGHRCAPGRDRRQW